MRTDFKFLAAIIALLFVLSLAASYAGDDSIGLRKDRRFPLKQSESQYNKPAVKIAKAKLPVQLSGTDWRASYYSHMYTRPWWPGAPGD